MSTARNYEALGLVAPFLLWGLGFALLYAGHGLACGVGVRPGHFDDETRLALSGLFIVFVIAHCCLSWWFWRRWRTTDGPRLRFVRHASFLLAVGATATTFWTGLPVLTLSICS